MIVPRHRGKLGPGLSLNGCKPGQVLQGKVVFRDLTYLVLCTWKANLLKLQSEIELALCPIDGSQT